MLYILYNLYKRSIIITIDVEKAFNKIQNPLIIKMSSKVGTDCNYVNLIKNIYKKCIANTICNGEISDYFLLRSVAKKRCFLYHFSSVSYWISFIM